MPSEYPPQLPEFKPTGGLSLTPTMEKPPSRYPSRPVSADCSDTGRSVDGSQDPAQSTDTLNRPCEQKEAKDESTNPVSAQNHDPSAIPTPQHEVDWESDRDPLNAMNWSWAKRSAQIGVICANLLVGSMATAVFTPGVAEIQAEFHTGGTSILATFAVSIFALGNGLAPLVLGPLSEVFGRVYIYNLSNGIFTVATLASAFVPNIASLIVLRFVSGCASAAPLAVGPGSLADMVPVLVRGRIVPLTALAPLLGLAFGPMIGGPLVGAFGWRSTQYCTAALGGFFTIVSLAVLRETYAKTILERKAKRMRETTGDDRYYSKLADKVFCPLSARISTAIRRPVLLLFLNPVVASVALYFALAYGYVFIFLTTLSSVYRTQYGFSATNVGLVFIGLAIGFSIGVAVSASIGDKIVIKLSGSSGPKPEHRLVPIIYTSPIVPAGLLLYGWTVQNNVFYIVPLIGTTLVGIGLVLTSMAIQTYLMDAFTAQTASVIAASNIGRYMLATFLPLVGGPLYKALGYGWGNSLLAMISVAITPAPILLYKYGETLRSKFSLPL